MAVPLTNIAYFYSTISPVVEWVTYSPGKLLARVQSWLSGYIVDPIDHYNGSLVALDPQFLRNIVKRLSPSFGQNNR